MPGVSRGIGRQSGADTKVLRIEQVWAHDLELDGLVVNRRRADQPLTQPPAAARQQRQAHPAVALNRGGRGGQDRKSTRLNSSHLVISYAVFCLKKKNSRMTLVS